jgi:hypothetical protein
MAEHVTENGGVPLERKVMVAVDDGEYSHYALMWVLDNLEESITKSSLVIFTAQPPPSNNHSFTAAALSSARMYCSVSASKCSFFPLFVICTKSEVTGFDFYWSCNSVFCGTKAYC